MGPVEGELLHVPVLPYRALGVILSDSISNTVYENSKTLVLHVGSQLSDLARINYSSYGP